LSNAWTNRRTHIKEVSQATDLTLFKGEIMQNQIVENISKPVRELNLPKLQSTYPHARVKGRVIRTKVVGVTFENRQEIIARLDMGDRVWLDREPDNPHDANAITVCRSNGEQIGYLNRQLAARITPFFRAYGYPIKGKVTTLTGSAWDGYILGVIISFKLPKTNQLNNNLQFEDWDDWDI